MPRPTSLLTTIDGAARDASADAIFDVANWDVDRWDTGLWGY